MGISPVLNGLIKKHVELQTSLRDLEDAADKAEDEINHLAKTIKILDPDYPIEELKPKRKRLRRIYAKTGNLKRHIGAYVARQAAPFTSADVRDALLADTVIQTKNADMTYLTLRVAIHLKQMASLGMIKEIDRLKNKNAIVWQKTV